MTSVVDNTVVCPECRRSADVLDRFTLTSSDGIPAEYLRIRCGLLSVLVTAQELSRTAPAPAAA
ncbi:hypothetical protein SAMN05443637_118138 [Pseudonocardia thermophila]|jgi:hypothetical protein|uniref:Uncharacterized protein n=1 Tax=Pseudonocardia thermophila TaxID=1848 RepID=A0A1M6Y216_PSETH|nr:hypothetical protein [Pseudonocardia thermophila]SHL12173.1 hypothetical protein SAMN05443637_118138 [Pseudonocardia thermophila]